MDATKRIRSGLLTLMLACQAILGLMSIVLLSGDSVIAGEPRQASCGHLRPGFSARSRTDERDDPRRTARSTTLGKSWRWPRYRLPQQLWFYQNVEPHHASTAAEGFLRGQAALRIAYGYYHWLRGQAAVYYQHARAMARDNHATEVYTWFDLREENRRRRGRIERKPFSQSDWLDMITSMGPGRLTEEQLTQAGEIRFPLPLRQPKYAMHCAELERLFKDRALEFDTARRADIDWKIGVACNRLLEAHKQRINQVSTADYIAAKEFVRSLKYEVRFEPRVVLLSSRQAP